MMCKILCLDTMFNSCIRTAFHHFVHVQYLWNHGPHKYLHRNHQPEIKVSTLPRKNALRTVNCHSKLAASSSCFIFWLFTISISPIRPFRLKPPGILKMDPRWSKKPGLPKIGLLTLYRWAMEFVNYFVNGL